VRHCTRPVTGGAGCPAGPFPSFHCSPTDRLSPLISSFVGAGTPSITDSHLLPPRRALGGCRWWKAALSTGCWLSRASALARLPDELLRGWRLPGRPAAASKPTETQASVRSGTKWRRAQRRPCPGAELGQLVELHAPVLIGGVAREVRGDQPQRTPSPPDATTGRSLHCEWPPSTVRHGDTPTPSATSRVHLGRSGPTAPLPVQRDPPLPLSALGVQPGHAGPRVGIRTPVGN